MPTVGTWPQLSLVFLGIFERHFREMRNDNALHFQMLTVSLSDSSRFVGDTSPTPFCTEIWSLTGWRCSFRTRLLDAVRMMHNSGCRIGAEVQLHSPRS